MSSCSWEWSASGMSESSGASCFFASVSKAMLSEEKLISNLRSLALQAGEPRVNRECRCFFKGSKVFIYTARRGSMPFIQLQASFYAPAFPGNALYITPASNGCHRLQRGEALTTNVAIRVRGTSSDDLRTRSSYRILLHGDRC